MEQELQQLKTVLKALVVSSPAQVDVRSLTRDYLAMTGNTLPVAKFGCRDPVSFLKEHLADCFVFQGPTHNPVLTVIVSESMKHIDKFVQRQKVSTHAKIKGKRTSIDEASVKPGPNLISNTFIKSNTRARTLTHPRHSKFNNEGLEIINRPIQKNSTPVNNTISVNTHSVDMANRINTISENMSTQLNITPANTNNTPHPIKQPHTYRKIVKNTETETSSAQSLGNNKENGDLKNMDSKSNGDCSENAYQNFIKKRMPLSNSLSCSSEKSDDGDSGRQTLSSSSSGKKLRLEKLKKQIVDLISKYPEGIWCTDLMRMYKAEYGEELNFSRFGFTSVLSLACSSAQVWAERRGGDWRVCAGGAAPGARAPPSPPPARAPPAPSDPDDALPGIDYEPDVFPEDCMHFMESIPNMTIDGIEPGNMLEVIVGEVYSPSHFWLIRLGNEYNIAMENLMDEMNEYYTRGLGRGRTLAAGAVRAGHYCASLYDGDWHRALIVQIVDSDTVKVRHVDYGTVERCAAAGLRALPRAWAALPAQAVRARLAAVRPSGAGRRWPHSCAAHFLRAVRDTRLVANVLAVDTAENVLEVLLIDTSTEEDRCISAELVRAGYADPAPAPHHTGESYLYPRFAVLESGATPNFGEIHAYLRAGIALEFVEDFRRHVPCAPPRAASPAPAPASPTPPSPPPSYQVPPHVFNRVPLPILSSRSTVPTTTTVQANQIPLRPQPPPTALVNPSVVPRTRALEIPTAQQPQTSNANITHQSDYTSSTNLTRNPILTQSQNVHTSDVDLSYRNYHASSVNLTQSQDYYDRRSNAAAQPVEEGAAVLLPASECEYFALLSRVDARAAQRFAAEAVARALARAPPRAPPRSALNPLAADFRAAPVSEATQTDSPAPGAHPYPRAVTAGAHAYPSTGTGGSHVYPSAGVGGAHAYPSAGAGGAHACPGAGVRPPPGFENN